MARPFLSVIIPAFNEAERLPLTLIDADRHLSEQDYTYEILVVDDGSTDHTSESAKRFAAAIKNLKVLNSVDNRGKGAAAKLGVLAARGNWRLIMDADNAVSVQEFQKVMEGIVSGESFAIVLASRGAKGTKLEPPPPFSRRLSDSALNRWRRLILRSKIKDALTGFHCYSAEAAEKIFPLLKISGWNFTAEALALGDRFGFQIKEVPAVIAYAPNSRLKLSRYLHMFWETIKIWWWLKNGKYRF